jgi:hypothetical protein
MSRPAEVIFLFIGGPHQVPHLAPVAAELSRIRDDLRVTCLYPDDATREVLEAVCRDYGQPQPNLERITMPAVLRGLVPLVRKRSLLKGPLLWQTARRARHAIALVTPERTSAALRYLGLRKRLMIHFRHGAGDRAPSSERRLKAFDLIVVPGEKDRERAHLAQGIPLDRIKVTGYVKLDWISRQGEKSPRLFDNERPTIVYNPHFDARISSWPQAESILALFAAQDQYNLIFAPHIRLSEGMSPAERKRWQSLAIPDKMLVDLGSVRLLDTSYLRVADIYLGDMSSQLYEFLANPRPAVFLNSHHVAWHGNPRYSGWALGEVAEDPAELLTAVGIAIERQASRVEAQKSAIKYAFGDYEGAARRGAAIVAETIDAPPLPRIRRIAVS